MCTCYPLMSRDVCEKPAILQDARGQDKVNGRANVDQDLLLSVGCWGNWTITSGQVCASREKLQPSTYFSTNISTSSKVKTPRAKKPGGVTGIFRSTVQEKLRLDHGDKTCDGERRGVTNWCLAVVTVSRRGFQVGTIEDNNKYPTRPRNGDCQTHREQLPVARQ